MSHKLAENRLGDPERTLALAYAPPETRDALRCLWRIDERMGAIVASTGDPAIGEMRLLWWREALEGLESRVPAEPLLADVAEALGTRLGQSAEWGAIAEGWHALLQEPIAIEELERFGRERGGRLFTLSAGLLGKPMQEMEPAGAAWALADLAANSSNAELADAAAALARQYLSNLRLPKWPVRLRPLGALTMLARRDVAGDPRTRRQGAPARVARMAWHRLTGR